MKALAIAGVGFMVGFMLITAVFGWGDKTTPNLFSNRVPPLPPKADLDTYFANMGIPPQKTKHTYGALLATMPINILGATDSATVSARPDLPRHLQGATNQVLLPKSSYKIAVLGDSMIDSLGNELAELRTELTKRFPDKSFELLNYGAGATDIEYGLHRLIHDYTYLDQPVPALLSQNPDVVVVESFAYNHWSNTQSDIDRQWLTIGKIISTIKNRNPDTVVILATTVAPYCPRYAVGSADLSPVERSISCTTVKIYQQNLVNFALSQNYPLADTYHATLDVEGEGRPEFINKDDNIHPSELGQEQFAKEIVRTLAQVIK